MHSIKYSLALAFLTVLLTACGGGGGGSSDNDSVSSSSTDANNSLDSSGPNDPTKVPGASNSNDATDTADTTKTVYGAAVKGPVIAATVKAYILNTTQADLKGKLIATGKTNSQAQITDLRFDETVSDLFIIEVTGGTDITTGKAPLITTLRTLLTQQQLAAGTPVFATPLSTFALELATDLAATQTGGAANNHDFLAALDDASDIVKKSFGFGDFDGLLADVDLFTTSPILSANTDQALTNQHRIALETFAALALETHVEVVNSGLKATANEVLAALAIDIADGNIDGLKDRKTPIDAFQKLGSNPATRSAVLLNILTQDPANLHIPGTKTAITKLISTLSDELNKLGSNVAINKYTFPTLTKAVPGNDLDGDRIADIIDTYPSDPNNLTRGLSISWEAPETRENGNPLPNSEIGGYEIYYYDSEKTLADATSIHIEGNSTNHEIAPGTLDAGTYMFAIAAYDKDQLFSDTTPPVEVVIN